MDDRRHNAATLLPQIPVADKKAVAEQRRQRVAHLRRFALKAFMHRDEGLRHGVGAVADEHPPVQEAGRKELIFEAFLVEHRESCGASWRSSQTAAAVRAGAPGRAAQTGSSPRACELA